MLSGDLTIDAKAELQRIRTGDHESHSALDDREFMAALATRPTKWIKHYQDFRPTAKRRCLKFYPRAVYVGNISGRSHLFELKDLFEQFGEVEHFSIRALLQVVRVRAIQEQGGC